MRTASIKSDYVVSGLVSDDGMVRFLSNDEDRCGRFFRDIFDEGQFAATGNWIDDALQSGFFKGTVLGARGYAQWIGKPLLFGKIPESLDERHVPLQNYLNLGPDLSVFRFEGSSRRNPIDFNLRHIDASEIQRLRFLYPIGPFNRTFVSLRMANQNDDYVFRLEVFEDGSMQMLSNDSGKAMELFNDIFDTEQFVGVGQWVDDQAMTLYFSASVVSSLACTDQK